MSALHQPLTLRCGASLPNRFVLAPLTNSQSHDDGSLGDDELRWLRLRAEGGFGAVMTCAASVHPSGVGFAGQLGIHDDAHLPGLQRLAAAIRAGGALGLVQLHHGGARALAGRSGGPPLAPSEDADTGARAMTSLEIETIADAFVAAAVRAERAGFDGVELHAAHGYLLSAFLSPTLNRRDDAWGGDPARRARLLDDLIGRVRAATAPGFVVGVRISPERFGIDTSEALALAARLLSDARLDFLDLSLWDFTKEAEDPALAGQTLAARFAALPRDGVRLGAAGKIASGASAHAALAAGFDFVLVGRGAILHHDLPRRIAADPRWEPRALPAPPTWLAREGVGPAFVDYLSRRFPGFVASPAQVAAAAEQAQVWAAARARLLYDGSQVAHRSCGVAIAETFGAERRPYVGLRRGGLDGQGTCGAIGAGVLLLGEVFGADDPASPSTPALVAAVERYHALWRERTGLGGRSVICNDLTAPLGPFQGPARHGFCTDLAATVAGCVAQVLVESGAEVPEVAAPER